MKRRHVMIAIIAIGVCNMFDGLMTLYWVSYTTATEFNPILRPLLDAHPMGFIAAKTVVVTILLGTFWVGRNRKLAHVGLILLLCCYVGVVIYHTWAVCRFIL